MEPSNDLTQALYQLLLAVLGVLTLVMGGYVTPRVTRWLAAQEQALIAGGREREAALLRGLADDAVRAVEQELAGYASGTKREAAVEQLRDWSRTYGVELSAKQAGDLVEAAVRVLQSSGLELRPDPNAPRQLPPRDELGRFVRRR